MDKMSMAGILDSRQAWFMDKDQLAKLFRASPDKTQAGLARALNVDPTVVNRMLKGRREIKVRELATIQSYFESHTEQSAVSVHTNVSNPVETPVKDVAAQPQNVPVYGTAHGSKEGDFFIIDETIEYVRRMPGIMGKAKVYALYVQGDSMVPWQETGDLIYVDPNVPARIGDYVVIQMKQSRDGDNRQAFVKRLIARSPTKLKVLQYNPKQEIEFPVDRVDKVHRVLSTKDLAGI